MSNVVTRRGRCSRLASLASFAGACAGCPWAAANGRRLSPETLAGVLRQASCLYRALLGSDAWAPGRAAAWIIRASLGHASDDAGDGVGR